MGAKYYKLRRFGLYSSKNDFIKSDDHDSIEWIFLPKKKCIIVMMTEKLFYRVLAFVLTIRK